MGRTYSRGALGLLLVALTGAAAAQDTVVAGTDDVGVPKRRKLVRPEYPPEAAAQGMRGIVILELIIGVDGGVDEVNVVRSVPPFDEAAVAAAEGWEYEPTSVNGQPVRVKLTVPISFLMKLPDITREEGIPELRQGAIPSVPPEAEREAKVKAQITLAPDGEVAEAQVTDGDSPWSEALILALRTWRFDANQVGGDIVTFRAEARFVPASRGKESRVPIKLSDLERRPAKRLAAAAAALAEPAPAGTAEAPAEQPESSFEATEAQPETEPETESEAAAAEMPDAEVPEPVAQPQPELPTPAATPADVPPDAEPAPAAEAVADATAQPAASDIETTPVESGSPELIDQPATEVMTLAPSATPAPPLRSDEPGVSSIQGVFLGVGLPDLTSGRRPVVPPFARMDGAVGDVRVDFAITPAGTTVVRNVDGPDIFQAAAREAVQSWFFVRETADRLFATAAFSYEAEGASVQVELDANPQ